MMNIYYSNPKVTIYWDDSKQWIYAEWRDIPTTQEVQQGAGAILKLLKEKQAANVLNDNRKVTGKWPTEAAIWVANTRFPQLFEAGLRKFAWIQSSDPGSRVSAKISETPNREQDVIQFFLNEAEARAWLQAE